MEWTSEHPSREGHYWYYDPELDILDTVRVFAKLNPETFVASGSMFHSRRVDTMDGHWAGPLVPPELDVAAETEETPTGPRKRTE